MAYEENSELLAYQGNPEHWLPLKVVEKYAAKAVEAGRKIWNGKAILPGSYDKLPVEWLADDKKIITDSHKAAGINFHIICNCAEGRISVFGMTDDLAIPLASHTMKKIAIESQLQPEDKHLLRRIIVYPVYPQDYEQFVRIAGRVKEAFDALETAMKKENIQKALDRIRDGAKMGNRSNARTTRRFS